jgi:tetratricopeptide (TPR) repeat protein
MSDSSYEEPLPPARAAATASGTYADGRVVYGRWHVYPEMAAAGLWTTPTDLAKFAIEIALSRHGKSNRVLSEKMVSQMLTPVLEDAGLGFFLDKDPSGLFGHNGADEGFQALLWMNSESGRGVAITANSDNGNAVGDLLLRSVAKEYRWNYQDPEQGAFGALMLIVKLKGTEAALRQYSEFKKSGGGTYKVEEGTLNRLGHRLLGSGQEQDAITVFRRNVQEYPKSANAYDSLGEAYLKMGQKDLAIRNYETSQRLDPKNQRAVDAIKELKEVK